MVQADTLTLIQFLKSQPLNLSGFKIGLELICKCRVTKLVEVPIHFGVRVAGKSKLDYKEKSHFAKLEKQGGLGLGMLAAQGWKAVRRGLVS